MNKPNAGYSTVGGPYKILADKERNSVLTGDGGKNNGCRFTCEELEVYQVIE
jgi:hypothetical protein